VASLLKHGIEIVYLSKYGKYVGRIQPEFSKNSILRKAQYRASDDVKKSIAICKSLVYGKLANMRTILLRAGRSNGSESKPEEITSPNSGNKIQDAVERIRVLTRKLTRCSLRR
jgi:Uncharacterized protein predicted to be involved in DNA repair